MLGARRPRRCAAQDLLPIGRAGGVGPRGAGGVELARHRPQPGRQDGQGRAGARALAPRLAATALDTLAVVARSVGLALGPTAAAADLERTVRRKYADPAEIASHRAEALAGPTSLQAAFLDRHLEPGSRVLDVGCAAGRTAFAAAARGHRVVAVDTSEAMARAAAELARTRGLATRICVMDARALGLAERCFDAVLMLGSTLSYIPRRENRLRALAEARRVLRPGGRLLVETQSRAAAPFYRTFFSLVAGARRVLVPPARREGWEVGDRVGIRISSAARSAGPIFFHMYAPDELAADLADAGFAPVPVQTGLYLMHYVGIKPRSAALPARGGGRGMEKAAGSGHAPRRVGGASMAVRTGEAWWQGSLREGAGHARTESGALDAEVSFRSRFESGTGTNPEELIGAAHAACFSMALAARLAASGHTADQIHTEARVHLEQREGRFQITRVDLSTEARIPGRIDEQNFQEHARMAKEQCPVSRALQGVQISLSARLEPGPAREASPAA